MRCARLVALFVFVGPVLFIFWSSSASLEGSVHTEAGVPLADATVRFQGQPTCTRTNRAGRFQVPGPPSARRLTATRPGYRIGWVSSASRPLQIRLSPLPSEDNDAYAWIAPDADAARPNNCANCHSAIHREWTSSGHANSARNHKFLALLDGADGAGPPRRHWNLGLQHPLGVGVCVNCHAPTFQDPTFEYGFRSLKDVAARGVHCDYCHKIAAAPTDKLGIRFGRDGYPLLRPKESDLLSFGPLEDAVRPGETFAHAPFYKESRYCASCHEGVVFGVHVYGTYSEWLQSPAGQAGQQCQTCHMAPTGKLTNIAPGKGGIERDPRTLASHGFPGGTSAMLRKCLRLEVAVDRSKEQTRVVIDLLAQNVGHRVPTGFIDRHLVLVVEVLDAKGTPIAALTGSKLDAAAGPEFAGKAGRLYAKKLYAGERSPLPFWVPADGMSDTRLQPGQPDRQVFTFPTTASAVRARVLYRRFWPETAEPFHWADNEILIVDQRRKS